MNSDLRDWRKNIDVNHFKKRVKSILEPVKNVTKATVEPNRLFVNNFTNLSVKRARNVLKNRHSDKKNTGINILRFMDDNENNHNLYFIVCKRKTISLRHLPKSIKCKHLKNDLELAAGLSSALDYKLCYPRNVEIDDNLDLVFNENIKDRAVLSIKFLPPWDEMVEILVVADEEKMIRHIKVNTEGMNDNARNNFLFCCAFLTSSLGNSDILRSLRRFCPNAINNYQTPFGRTCAHTAAYQDHIGILNELNCNGLNLFSIDSMGKTAMNIAENNQAIASFKFCKHLKKQPVHFACEVLQQLDVTDNSDKTNSISKQRISSAPASILRTNSNMQMQRKVVWNVDNDSGFGTSTDFKTERISSAATNYSNNSNSSGSRNSTLAQCHNLQKVLEDWELEFLGEFKNNKKTRICGRDIKKSNEEIYFKGRYHTGEENDIDWSKRPANSNSRFRAWKTWLLNDDKNMSVDNETVNKQMRNKVAFQRWLEKKRRKGLLEDNNTSSLGFVNPLAKKKIEYRKTPTKDITQNNSESYNNWIEDKQDYFIQQKEISKQKKIEEAMDPIERKKNQQTKVNIFSLVDCSYGDVKIDDSSTYKDAYKNWKQKSYDNKKKHITKKDIEMKRKQLRIEGMLYKEWCQLKQDNSMVGKPKPKEKIIPKPPEINSKNNFIFVHQEN